jgi:hypothetical protein
MADASTKNRHGLVVDTITTATTGTADVAWMLTLAAAYNLVRIPKLLAGTTSAPGIRPHARFSPAVTTEIDASAGRKSPPVLSSSIKHRHFTQFFAA